MKSRYGCKEKAPIPYSFDGEEAWFCPKKPQYENSAFYAELFRLYRWHKKGLLPDAGTWMDQPIAFVTFMEIIDMAVSEGEAERMKRLNNT